MKKVLEFPLGPEMLCVVEEIMGNLIYMMEEAMWP